MDNPKDYCNLDVIFVLDQLGIAWQYNKGDKMRIERLRSIGEEAIANGNNAFGALMRYLQTEIGRCHSRELKQILPIKVW